MRISCCRPLRNPFISVTFRTSKTAAAAQAKKIPVFPTSSGFFLQGIL
jgi:hypothetical protein